MFDENTSAEILAYVISGGLIFVVILIVFLLCSNHDERVWNNGHCSCGGDWKYVMPIGHAYTTTYLYNCDQCGKTYEFDKKR